MGRYLNVHFYVKVESACKHKGAHADKYAFQKLTPVICVLLNLSIKNLLEIAPAKMCHQATGCNSCQTLIEGVSTRINAAENDGETKHAK